MKIHYGIDECHADVTNLASLIWASFSVESMLLWYFGRAHFRLEIARKKLTVETTRKVAEEWHHAHDDQTRFSVRPISESKLPLRYSNITQVGALLDMKLFPHQLVEPWDGKDEKEVTLIEHGDMRDEVDLGLMAYTCSDAALDLFKRGATIVRAQYSLKRSQIMGNIGLEEREFKELVDMNHPDYVPSDNVGDLP